jgi:pimeloyl-ACP methyl ester carboxylesterase
MKSLYLVEHDCFIAYNVLPGHGPVHVYLAPLICPSTATMLQVATHPRLAGRAAILVDYLGCGASDRPLSFSHTMRDHARTIASILDHEGVADCVIVGHSMGGTVGLHLALDRPDLVARLVLGESNLGPGGGGGTRYIASFSLGEYVGSIAPRELIALRQKATAGDTMAAAMLSIRLHGSDARAVHAASCDIVGLDEKLLQHLLDLTIPRAFIYGARTLDELDGRWTADVPDRTMLDSAGVVTLVVPDAGHFMYFDNLDGYVAALDEAERLTRSTTRNDGSSRRPRV